MNFYYLGWIRGWMLNMKQAQDKGDFEMLTFGFLFLFFAIPIFKAFADSRMGAAFKLIAVWICFGTILNHWGDGFSDLFWPVVVLIAIVVHTIREDVRKDSGKESSAKESPAKPIKKKSSKYSVIKPKK
jgi:hypothetical protein